MKKFNEAFIRKLPKAEIHCHLDGSMRVETIIELAEQYKVSLPSHDYSELQTYLQVGNDCKDLVDYLKAFSVTVSVLQHKDALIRSVYELCEDASKENVRAIEIRYSPLLSIQKELTLETAIEALLEGKEKAEKDFNIIVNIILCGLRHLDPQTTLDIAHACLPYRHSGIVALDLAGPEKDFPVKKHLDAFYLARNNCMGITVHAGEAFGPKSIAQALFYANAHRIGHGTSLKDDLKLLEYVNDFRIPIEMCVSCNVQTKAVPHVDSHPIKEYLDKGLCVSINTDNRLISDTTLTKEYLIVCETFDISEQDLRTLVINSFDSLFLPHKKKITILQEISSELDELFALI